MPQIFPKALNPIAKMIVLSLPLLGGVSGVTGAAFYRSSYATGIHEIRIGQTARVKFDGLAELLCRAVPAARNARA